MQLAIAIIALVLGSGCVVGAIGYIVKHERAHQHIDDRLENGAGDFGEIKSSLQDLGARMTSMETSLAGIRTDVGWLKKRNGYKENTAGG